MTSADIPDFLSNFGSSKISYLLKNFSNSLAFSKVESKLPLFLYNLEYSCKVSGELLKSCITHILLSISSASKFFKVSIAIFTFCPLNVLLRFSSFIFSLSQLFQLAVGAPTV